MFQKYSRGKKIKVKSDKQLWDICKEIYREIFKQAEPKANFDIILKSVKGKEKVM